MPWTVRLVFDHYPTIDAEYYNILNALPVREALTGADEKGRLTVWLVVQADDIREAADRALADLIGRADLPNIVALSVWPDSE
jgi:hypothetical protein